MQRTIACCGVVFLLTWLVATPLLAQVTCEPEETIAQCLERHLMDSSVQRVMAKERADLRSQPTGVDTGGANVATNTKDFNPLMALAGLLGASTNGGSETGEGTLLFDLNLPIPGLKVGQKAQLQAFVNTQPQLSELVRNKIQGSTMIPDDERDARVGQLEEKIGDLADHTIRLTYNYESGSFGRNLEQYRGAFQALCKDALDATVKGRVGKMTGQLGVASDQPLPSDKAELATDLMEQEAAQLVADQEQALESAGIARYDQLVDNQPQLYFTAAKKFRDPLVGPDEFSVRVTYEGGLANLNTVPKECGGWKDEKCFKDYVKGKAAAIDWGHRLAFFAEYVDIDGETIDTGLSALGPIPSESARKLVVSAGWGFDLNLERGEPVKFDLVGSYEDVSDDPMRQDRGILRLTFTRKVGDMSVPFGIVYANHSEFLDEEEADTRLSAHIGLVFKMDGGNGNQE